MYKYFGNLSDALMYKNKFNIFIANTEVCIFPTVTQHMPQNIERIIIIVVIIQNSKI